MNKKIRKKKLVALWLILLPLLILLFFNIYPFIRTVQLSFFQWVLTKPLERNFIGFNNYIKLFQDHDFWESLRITLIYVAAAVIIEIIIGFILASILDTDIPGKNIFTTIFLIPMAISPVVVGLFWRAWFAPDFGLIQYFLEKIRLGNLVPIEGFIGQPKTALGTMIFVDYWQWTSFVVLIFLAGLKTLPDELFEAAELDGANNFQKFRYLTIHLLKPIILVVVLFRTMDAFRIFDVIWLMSKGGPGRSTETLSIFVYRTGFYYWNIGYATVISLIMLEIYILPSTLSGQGKLRISLWYDHSPVPLVLE